MYCQGVKSVQIRSFFWSVFSCIQPEYGKIRTRKNSVFGNFSRSVYQLSHIFLTRWWNCAMEEKNLPSEKKNRLTEQTNFLEYLFVMLPRKISQYRMYMSGDQCRAVPKPEVLGGGGQRGRGGGVKPLVYRQWKLHHATLIKWVRTTR